MLMKYELCIHSRSNLQRMYVRTYQIGIPKEGESAVELHHTHTCTQSTGIIQRVNTHSPGKTCAAGENNTLYEY